MNKHRNTCLWRLTIEFQILYVVLHLRYSIRSQVVKEAENSIP